MFERSPTVDSVAKNDWYPVIETMLGVGYIQSFRDVLRQHKGYSLAGLSHFENYPCSNKSFQKT